MIKLNERRANNSCKKGNDIPLTDKILINKNIIIILIVISITSIIIISIISSSSNSQIFYYDGVEAYINYDTEEFDLTWSEIVSEFNLNNDIIILNFTNSSINFIVKNTSIPEHELENLISAFTRGGILYAKYMSPNRCNVTVYTDQDIKNWEDWITPIYNSEREILNIYVNHTTTIINEIANVNYSNVFYYPDYEWPYIRSD